MTSPTEARTVSFADAEAGWYGWARLASDSALAVLLRDGELVSAGGDDLSISDDAVAWDGVELTLEPVSAPVERSDGPAGTEQLVRVRGTVHGATVDAPGQLGRTTGEWPGAELVRTVAVWLGDGEGVVLEAVRPSRARGHGDETVWATLVEQGEPVPVIDPRLSTTYDGDGHHRRAGLELWMTEEEGYPVRVAGEVVCGSSLDLGELALDLAFFGWRSGGREGVGRYDILRKR